LWGEFEQTGRLSFASFYARRARRLLPAAMLVVVVTVVASTLWLSPLRAQAVTKDAIASALYVANYRFAALRTDYLASDAPPSPLQHYWSLGVEEQFYIVWPLLLLAASLAWRRVPRGRDPTHTPTTRCCAPSMPRSACPSSATRRPEHGHHPGRRRGGGEWAQMNLMMQAEPASRQ
jgi:hypothetical protein